MKIIVIQVHMESNKCRNKALKIAAAFEGVQSVSIEGEIGDQVVVIGDGIDSVCLTNKLRKKFSYATLVSVEDANIFNNGVGDDSGGQQTDDTTSMENSSVACCCANYPPPCPSYVVVYDSYPVSCSIL